MSVLNLFRKRNSASAARDRLQILLAHEKTSGPASALLFTLREEILAAIAKHVDVDQTKVNVNMKREETYSIVEIDFEVPEPLPVSRLRVAS
ncbi:cell division topological specificity factor MinE [Flaviflagellibacter deserti]|jgi:cell division topological specificity factor|uniref:Cell division topological specificity factor n=1 Tax=Flaviflagellibacter deserti TaxID=2267266 RepID=A0ABV9Z608_9HYPH